MKFNQIKIDQYEYQTQVSGNNILNSFLYINRMFFFYADTFYFNFFSTAEKYREL